VKTTSELAFEKFLAENGLSFQRVEEQATPRPDYLVQVGDMKVLFEVKEIAEDKHTEPLKVHSRTVGDHIRSKIDLARRQIQYGANQGIPSVLLVYNNLDPIFLFGTEDHDFISAMYGEHTIAIDRESMKVVDSYPGRNWSLDEKKNRSFSAVGHLYPFCGRLEVKPFANVFAKVKLPALPPCFKVQKVEITNE
jgi:hypothetical protein